MRLCSRKFPTMERTVIFSLTSGIPVLTQQIPRTISSIFTPALLVIGSLLLVACGDKNDKPADTNAPTAAQTDPG